MNWVGRSLPRVEDRALLQGQGRYVADIADQTRSCKHLAFVRSPVAAGRIVSISYPEDVVVFTADNLPTVKPIRAALDRPDFVPIETPVLASSVVRHSGEPIALVVGDTRAEAEDLAEQVVVEIDATDPVIRIADALDPGAVSVHSELPMPMGANVVLDAHFSTEGLDAAMLAADEVFELKFRSHRQSALPIEARGAVAVHDISNGRTTLTASTQMPHVLRTAVSDVLGFPESELRVVVPEVGGAFGQKMCVPREYVAVVAVARHLKTPVAWIEDRLENLLASWHSRDHEYEIRGAFSRDGRLLAIDADLICNVGAYSNYPVTFGVEPLMAFAELPGPYKLREYRVRSRAVTTNLCPIAPYRGVSRPAITMALERLMDVAAGKLGIGALEIRRINLPSEFPHRMPTGISIDPGSYVESLDVVQQEFDLQAFRVRQKSALTEGRFLGVGVSVFGERTGYGTPAFAARAMEITPGYETAHLEMNPSGDVTARIGASPHGQGLATTLSQILADELGLTPDRIQVVHGDTDRTPYGWGTFASRSLVLAGGAVKQAAALLRDQISRIAAELLEARDEDIVIEAGLAKVAGTNSGVPLDDLARVAHHQAHRLPDGVEPGLSAVSTYDPSGTFSNACHLAVVEVDTITGHVDLQKFLVVEDAGQLVNPQIVEGQIHGGVVQGIANALYEELVHDDQGNLLASSLMDYLPPTVMEVPEIEIHHLATINDSSITGAKGIGEGGTIGAPAAILNAISDALIPLGVSVNEMPATPSRLRALIREAEAEKVMAI